jgi:MoaA/NifB/PqqE/SkfB family radical SAM enzyme
MENSRIRAIESVSDPESLRVRVMKDNMHENKAYQFAVEKITSDIERQSVLNDFLERYSAYRQAWLNQPKSWQKNLYSKDSTCTPLCIDIEVAAICDLACPFCYRQFLATPDKIMDSHLAFMLIEESAKLGVPSIKFNWRGEPLLNPNLSEYIKYAKKCGILETIINTNATLLDEKKSVELIESGLDMIIFSFDGGTKETYEKMRPGRFGNNSFEAVYNNIINFCELRKKLGKKLPLTKIQMILTESSFREQEQFFALFKGHVDDVSVKQYSERGADINELDADALRRVKNAIETNQFGANTPYMRLRDGSIFLSKKRLPCEQPFQRMLVTYDGRVGMCCYDWGAQHLVGYVDDSAFNSNEEYKKVLDKSKSKHKTFKLLQNIQMPISFNEIKKDVKKLQEIWMGEEMNKVRNCHSIGGDGTLKVCEKCTFKEVHEWVKI